MIILFIITLIIFLNIKTMDIGLYSIRYIDMFGNEATEISDRLYTFIVVAMVIFGLVTIKNFIDNISQNEKEKTGNKDINNEFIENQNQVNKSNSIDDFDLNQLSQLNNLLDQKVITKKEFDEIKKRMISKIK